MAGRTALGERRGRGCDHDGHHEHHRPQTSGSSHADAPPDQPLDNAPLRRQSKPSVPHAPQENRRPRKTAAAGTIPLVLEGSPTGSRRRPATPNCSLGRPRGVAAKLLEPLAAVSRNADCGLERESIEVTAERAAKVAASRAGAGPSFSMATHAATSAGGATLSARAVPGEDTSR